MQRIFNPSQYRSSGMTTLTKENFTRVMTESLNKALSPDESPVKEKHVRKLLIGSFQAESGAFFWSYLPVIRLKENQIVCWKFCHVLHKMLRDGHRQVVANSHERQHILLDCGNMWRHVEDGYGQLIHRYCVLLYDRIRFLNVNPRFPNDLKITDQQLEEISENDMNVLFMLCCDMFDNLENIVKLQELVLAKVEHKKYNSMTSVGQCHLAPLVAFIQDSSLFYDYAVKILFKLHNNLNPDDLEGLCKRFHGLHKKLKSFYINASNLQYFKTLIQIPHLSEVPPNFRVASDLQQHVAPRVVMIANPELDQYDSHPEGSQPLVNLDDASMDAFDSNSSQSIPFVSSTIEDPAETSISQSSNTENQIYLDKIASLLQEHEQIEEKLRALEEENITIRRELASERIDHKNTRSKLTNQIKSIKEDHANALELRDEEVKKLKEQMTNLTFELRTSKNSIDKIKDELKRAEHDKDISQDAMKKLVKDLSCLKTERETLLKQAKPVIAKSQDTANIEANERMIKELQKKIDDLNIELREKNIQQQNWEKERELLLSSKDRLEKLLDSTQEDTLMAEMNETDKIIKEATKRIEELSEKSRKFESGIKLQVNEKISEVCSNLMKAVRNLIIQSRLLQREVVGGDGKTNCSEFYKRNSAWTEGLISAANVVAMAARSLVDSADRAMSGQAKFSELAAAAHEIAAATTQLVVASRVKANKDSEKLKILTGVAKQVNQCTNQVVDTARVCAELIEQEIDKIDISSLSLHQTKKLEMETQVKLLELEDKLSKERIKLGLLRRQHYEREEAQEIGSDAPI